MQIKKRTKKLSELFQSYRPYEHQLGKVQKILITEIAHDGESLVGHNKFYEQVLLKEEGGSEKLMGKMVTVKVIETGQYVCYALFLFISSQCCRSFVALVG